MPTGYTATLCEKDQSFAFFALGCARAFGACIDQRDSPRNELPNLPKKKVNTYHETALASAQATLDSYMAMSDKAKMSYGKKCKRDEIKSNKQSLEEKKIVRNRVLAMIEKTREWTPPTHDHEGLKKFMLEQLDSTLSHDGDTAYYEDALAKAKAKDPMEFFNAAVDGAKWSVEYHTKEMAKEETREDNRGQWITELYRSLGDDAELAWALLQK